MEQIDRALAARGRTALTALHGLGGIGKTQLARRYAQERQDRYRLGLWFNAENEAGLVAALAAVGREAGLLPDPDAREMAKRTLRWACGQARWLIVFDNAADEPAMRPWLEHLHGEGDVILTSRSEAWGSSAAPVSVTQWPLDESADYLLRRTGQQDRAGAAALAKDLDGLALALEHAAAKEQIELALASDLRQFGPDHPNIAVSRVNFGTILLALGDADGALREIDQALEVLRKKLPAGHPDVGNAEGWRRLALEALANRSTPGETEAAKSRRNPQADSAIGKPGTAEAAASPGAKS